MKIKDIITIKPYHSPCGSLLLGSLGDRLCLCDWQGPKDRHAIARRLMRTLNVGMEAGTSDAIEAAERQLDEYFAARRQRFDVPLLFAGTDFQKMVWNELLKVPYGTTLSYKELAQRMGAPKSVRVVAAANGANALSVFVPCHRIIGANGSPTGYAGGLEAKRRLLELEKAIVATAK